MDEIPRGQKLLHHADLTVLGGAESGCHAIHAVAAMKGTAHGAEGIDGVGVQGRGEQAIVGVGLVDGSERTACDGFGGLLLVARAEAVEDGVAGAGQSLIQVDVYAAHHDLGIGRAFLDTASQLGTHGDGGTDGGKCHPLGEGCALVQQSFQIIVVQVPHLDAVAVQDGSEAKEAGAVHLGADGAVGPIFWTRT